MTEMVERVARAICGWHLEGDPHGFTWEQQNPQELESYRKQARAAIEAMREPTEPMLKEIWGANDLDRLADYQSVIDAALEEEGK